MIRLLTISWLILLFAMSGRAAEANSFPKGLSPVFGMAVARMNNQSLELTLTCPQARWQVVGERVVNLDNPKLTKEPEFRVQIDRALETISLRGPARTAKVETRVVGLDGKDLSHEDILKRLEKETPVMVAIDGRMIDPYYLQIAKPETLIILLGPWDGAPATKLFPASAGKPDKQTELQRDK